LSLEYYSTHKSKPQDVEIVSFCQYDAYLIFLFTSMNKHQGQDG